MATAAYNFATLKKPLPTFLSELRKLAANDGVTILAGVVCEGPGCANIGLLLETREDPFAECLCMHLQPAKWSYLGETAEPLQVGEFIDHINAVCTEA